MVLAVAPEDLEELQELARTHDTTCEKIGEVTNTNRLRVFYENDLVCDLDCDFLHSPPRLQMESRYRYEDVSSGASQTEEKHGTVLNQLLAHINLCSRHPVIREYDHEVQGNTIIKPLGGPSIVIVSNV